MADDSGSGVGGVWLRRVAYLERRYTALESEIADALRQSPTDELEIADLKYRKLIIADEIQHNRRLVGSEPLTSKRLVIPGGVSTRRYRGSIVLVQFR